MKNIQSETKPIKTGIWKDISELFIPGIAIFDVEQTLFKVEDKYFYIIDLINYIDSLEQRIKKLEEK